MTDVAESILDHMGEPEPMPIQLVPDGLPKITKFSDIQTKTLEWLWPGRIPLGKLTVLAGDPGLGKSLITVAIATALTEEAKWPDCNEYALGGSVVLLSAEDDEGDTIKPRLMAAGADPEKVYSMDSIIDLGDRKRGFSLDCDIEKLSNVLKTVPDCRLLVIDPISAFMGNVDSHNVADVRGVLAPLTELAQSSRIAVLYVTHLNKGKGTPMSRISGSGAYVAAARSAMLVGRDPLNPDRRVLVSLKCNLSKEPEGIAYKIKSNTEDLPVVQWEPDFVNVTAEELLGSTTSHQVRDDAKSWLLAELQNGPVSAKEIKADAESCGVAFRTLERAKKDLGVQSKTINGIRKWCLAE